MSATKVKKLDYAKIRSAAEIQFIELGMSAKAISDDWDVSEATLSKWRKGKAGEKDWDTRRAEFLSAPHKIKELLLGELMKVSQGEKSTIDADALSKLSKVIESISGKVSLQVSLSVLKEADNYTASQDPKAAIEVSKWHKRYLHHKASME